MNELRATARGARMFVTVAEVEHSRLAQLLPPALTPRRLYGSIAALSLQFLDIPESTVGPYRECTLSVLCKDEFDWPPGASAPIWRSMPGFPIWIAVTNEMARWYGREIWAYPKFVGEVQFELERGDFRGSAAVHEQGSVRCSAAIADDLEPGELELRSISCRESSLLLAPMPGHAHVALHWDPNATFTIELDVLGLGTLHGSSATGIYAEEFCFELLPPVAQPMSRIAVHGVDR
jgi:hypothetical protein